MPMENRAKNEKEETKKTIKRKKGLKNKMSFPFLILAGISCLVFAGDIQASANTNTIPLMIYLVYALSGTFFLYAVLRVFRMLA